MVINDSPEVLALIAEVLREDEGYEVRTFMADSVDVGDIISQRPVLILIDLLLSPDPSELIGWELLDKILDEPAFADVPLIVMSAEIQALREHEPALKRRPRVAILHKPFSVRELTDTVESLLEDRPLPSAPPDHGPPEPAHR
ncbi:MAG TPA: response regulator [candidate division Zixibacteria bacterium]|nr:response regulator [candidate division Zixibacteria bacterium]